jgi:hypothetical protein
MLAPFTSFLRERAKTYSGLTGARLLHCDFGLANRDVDIRDR